MAILGDRGTMIGAIAVAALVAAVVVAVPALQRRLLYLPARDVVPVDVALPGAEEVTLATEDGLELRAWYLAPPPEAPTIVVFHGNAGTLADRAALARGLHDGGVGVLLVEYRGYGGNPGAPSEAGLGRDAQAAVEFLGSRPEVDPGRVVYLGESLGAGVAVGLAVERPPAALVLRSPFTSLPDVARVHYPFLPRWLVPERYPNLERMRRLEVPTLVVAGDRDTVVPFAQSRAVYDEAPEPKELVVVEGADHNDPRLVVDRLVEATIGFLDEVLPPSGR